MHAGMDPATEEAMGGADAAQGTGWGDLGQATVVDGVRLIAGGIESVLQRLQIQVHALSPLRPTPSAALAAAKYVHCACPQTAARVALQELHPLSCA